MEECMKMVFNFASEFIRFVPILLALLMVSMITTNASGDAPKTDAELVAALDTEYQAAVMRNDAVTMDRILADDFVLVLGNGTVYTKPDLIKEARAGSIAYVQQTEIDNSQKVRVWGNTAVVTAKLWVKGTSEGKSFDRKLWFSDTYIKTGSGWRYVFGQASLALPSEP